MPEQLHKIASACVVECVRQQVEVFELGNLLLAYNYALIGADDRPWPEAVMTLARMIEPNENDDGFRTTPVTFASGGSAVPARQIRRAMIALFSTMGDAEASADEIVHEFLKIHPFRDGNGRVAFVLHNWLNRTLLDPRPLPIYEFV